MHNSTEAWSYNNTVVFSQSQWALTQNTAAKQENNFVLTRYRSYQSGWRLHAIQRHSPIRSYIINYQFHNTSLPFNSLNPMYHRPPPYHFVQQCELWPTSFISFHNSPLCNHHSKCSNICFQTTITELLPSKLEHLLDSSTTTTTTWHVHNISSTLHSHHSYQFISLRRPSSYA